MVVAMVPVRMVEATVNDVINVVTMRNRFVTAAWSMNMAILM